MISRPVAVVLLAAGCLTAAAGGSYLAVRQNAAAAEAAAPLPAPAATPVQPVSETEAIVEPTAPIAPATTPARKEEPKPAPVSPARQVAPRRPAPVVAQTPEPAMRETAPVQAQPERSIEPPAPVVETAAPPVPVPAVPPVDPEPRPAAPPVPTIEEVTIPAASVIGLEIETALTSEKARVEDRIEARVTRDVFSDGRLAIPAGTRMIGSVTLVERGGKVKERARLGVRFHTLVLADGRQVGVRTDTIFREGQSPTGESSRKIGGAAVGGAVLGAIMGGSKGAMIGGAAGAAGGTAAVMAGERNAATIPTGTVLNARLAAPVTLDIERR